MGHSRNTAGRRRRVAAVLVFGVAATGCIPSGFAPDATQGVTPVAPTGESASIAILGDSLSAGNGTGPIGLAADDQWCTRSDAAFGRRLGRMLTTFAGVGASVDVQACFGATTKSMRSQAEFISAETDVVYLQGGANDLGWASALFCILRRITENSGCDPLAGFVDVEARIPLVIEDLRSTIAQVRQTAPAAKIVLSDYVPLFGKPPLIEIFPPCLSAVGIGQPVRRRMWDLTTLLNTSIAQLAAEENVEVIKLSALGAGRSLCESSYPWYRELTYQDYEYVNGRLTWVNKPASGFFDLGSYHGNHLMHAAWAKAAYELISDRGWLGHPLPSVP